MFKKIAIIKTKTTLHKRSVALSLWNMFLCATVIPYVVCMAAWLLFEGVPPEAFRYLQFIVYFVVIGKCWYSCYLRKWSHSYMLDYTKKILDPQIWYCPRCYSPIKVSQQEYTYEQKIGETITREYYSDGSVITTRDPIMSKEKVILPHLVCKERSCHLGAKTQKASAQSAKVRSQLKDNYSFCEMPNTLNKTFRLIAGDQKDNYRKSMAAEMCHGGFWGLILLLSVVLLIISKVKNLGVLRNAYNYLFASIQSTVLYFVTIGLLSVAYIAFLIVVWLHTKTIVLDDAFNDEVTYFDDLGYDIYLTKRLSEAKKKERKKEMKQARKAGLAPDNSQARGSQFSDGQWEKRKKSYRLALMEVLSDTLVKNGYSIESTYYCECYILRAHSLSSNQPDCDFFITKDSCFLRGSARFSFGAHQGFVNRAISETLQNENYGKVDFYVGRDLLYARVGCGILASSALDVAELDAKAVAEVVSIYLTALRALRRNVSPEVLATVPSEYGTIREANWNGFTLE